MTWRARVYIAVEDMTWRAERTGPHLGDSDPVHRARIHNRRRLLLRRERPGVDRLRGLGVAAHVEFESKT